MDLGSNYNRLKESISDISNSLTAKEANSVTGLSQVPDEIRKIETVKEVTFEVDLLYTEKLVNTINFSNEKTSLKIDNCTQKTNVSATLPTGIYDVTIDHKGVDIIIKRYEKDITGSVQILRDFSWPTTTLKGLDITEATTKLEFQCSSV